MERYDPATNTWTILAAAGSRWASIAPMANARAYLAGVAANGKIYAIGGMSASLTNLNQVEAFDPVDGSWHSVTNLQVARGGVGACAVGNTIYPDIMLQGRRTFATANIGTAPYAIGGWNGNYPQTAERRSFDSFLPLTLK